MIRVAKSSISDVRDGNVKVIAARLEKYGVDGFGWAVAMSSKDEDLKNLFEQLRAIDVKAVRALSSLKSATSEELLHALCAMIDTKVQLIDSFEAKHN